MKEEAKTKRQLIQELTELRQQSLKLEKAKAKPKRIEKALLKSEKEAKRLAQENALVAEIGRIIGSTPNIEEVFERFSKAVAKLIPFDRIVINLGNLQEDDSFVRYVAGVDVPNRRVGEHVPLTGTATVECFRTKSSLLLQPKDAKEVEELGSRFPRFLPNLETGIRSAILVPLIAEDQTIGVLSLRTTKTKAYTEQDVRLAESIASQIAGAVANAQLYEERLQAETAARKNEEEAKRLAQENAVMAEIGRIISSTLNIEEVYERFVEEVRKLIQGDRITIAIVNRDGSTYTLAYAWGLAAGNRKTGGSFPLAGTTVEEAMRTRSTMLIQEEDMEKVLRKFSTLSPYYNAGLQSMIMVPLISKNNVIGTLHLRSLRPKAYTQSDVILAEKVVNQITGAIDNARLYAEHEQATEDLRKREEENRKLAKENEIIAEIGRIIGSTLNIGEVYEYFTEEVRKIIPVDGITIGVINHKDKIAHVPYSAGLYVPGRKKDDTVLLPGTATGEVLRTRSSLLIQEKSEEITRRFPGLLPYIQSGVRSLLIVPLISRDVVIGVILFLSKKVEAYSAKDLNLAERIGNQIAGAVANAQLYMERMQAEEAVRKSELEARKLAQENALVAEIGKILSSTLDIKEVYEGFAAEMRKLMPFDRMAMNVIDPRSYTFTIPYVSGMQIESRETGKTIPLPGTGMEEIMRTRTSMLIHRDNREAIITRLPGLIPVMKAGFQSIMMVPLISQNEVIAVLNMQSTQPGAYTEEDLRLAERISSQIAGAIANTLLFNEHKRAEEALRESEERYRNILATIEDGFYEVDIAGNFIFFNDAMCRILGYAKDEIMGMNNRQYMDRENAKKIFQFFNTVYRTGQTARRLDWEIIRKGGVKRYVEASVSLIKDTAGKRIGFRGILQDISDRKQAEKEMTELQEQLRQSQKIEAIGQLAGGIAHDFNNALTLIKTSAQLALLGLKAGDPLRQTFELIDKATEQSANLTRQLLAFSRRQIMELKVINLNYLLQEMDKMLHRVIGEDIELVSVLAEDLGRVKVDPGQMEQVILNFVLNARDAMPKGGKLTIETANVDLDEKYGNTHVGVKPGRYVQVAVSDTGIGMTPEVRERVFEPFFTTKERGKGTGLGLSTVYGIVKQSEGNVWVYSELGKGTTFKVYLPRVDELLKEEEGKDLQLKGGLPRGEETILVAEDEGDVRNLVVQILRNQGYEVLEAANGGEAFIICEKHEGAIDLLMTDVVMPLMSGRELADRLLLLHPEMKVLYTSGYTDDAIVRHGVLEEGVNFIPKPFSVEALALKVREVLDQ